MTTAAPSAPSPAQQPSVDVGRAVESVGQAVGGVGQAVESAQRVAHEQTLPTGVALLRGRTGLAVAGVAFLGFVGIFLLVRAKRS